MWLTKRKADNKLIIAFKTVQQHWGAQSAPRQLSSSHLLNKTSGWAHANGWQRLLCFAQTKPYSVCVFTLFSAPRSFSFDAFYTSLGVDKLSVTCREKPLKPHRWESIFAFPFHLELWWSKQTGPKQYDIYHISITLNASVSILHCLNHTPVTRHTRCGGTIMGRHCSPPSGALIRLACA